MSLHLRIEKGGAKTQLQVFKGSLQANHIPPHNKAVEYTRSKARAFLNKYQKITYQPHEWLKINLTNRTLLSQWQIYSWSKTSSYCP